MTELERRGGRSRRGVVTAFDETAGLGTVTGDDGVAYPFHCIEIADGSRTVAVGTAVAFDLLPKFGRWEAAAISS